MISFGPYMIFPDAWYYGDPPDEPEDGCSSFPEPLAAEGIDEN